MLLLHTYLILPLLDSFMLLNIRNVSSHMAIPKHPITKYEFGGVLREILTANSPPYRPIPPSARASYFFPQARFYIAWVEFTSNCAVGYRTGSFLDLYIAICSWRQACLPTYMTAW